MPRNVATGKADRHSLSAKAVFEYRLEQHKKPKVRSVRPRKSKKPEKSQDDNLQAEAPSGPGSGLSPSMSLAKTTLDGTSSKGNSPAPEQEMGTSSALLSVTSVAPQISAPSFQGHQQPSPATLLQLRNDYRNHTRRFEGIEERIGACFEVFGGLMRELTAVRKDLEQDVEQRLKFIGS